MDPWRTHLEDREFLALPFDQQLAKFRDCTRDSEAPVAWYPSAAILKRSNIGRLMEERGFNDYPDLYRWSCSEPGAFWQRMLHTLQIQFSEPPKRILGRPDQPRSPGWLDGALLNITDSCFTAPGERIAVIDVRQHRERQVVGLPQPP